MTASFNARSRTLKLSTAMRVERQAQRLFCYTRHLQKAFTEAFEFLVKRDPGHSHAS